MIIVFKTFLILKGHRRKEISDSGMHGQRDREERIEWDIDNLI